jgi:hypothetical protein
MLAIETFHVLGGDRTTRNRYVPRRASLVCRAGDYRIRTDKTRKGPTESLLVQVPPGRQLIFEDRYVHKLNTPYLGSGSLAWDLQGTDNLTKQCSIEIRMNFNTDMPDSNDEGCRMRKGRLWL